MTSLQVADKSEKSLTEILIVVILVGVLMASFVFYFFKNKDQVTLVGFESLAQIFSARVNGIHAQWFMDQKPKFVVVQSRNTQSNGGNTLSIPVNKAGWVDSQDEALSCQVIWQYVMESPLKYMKSPIGAVLVEKPNDELHYCQYSLSSGEYFTYHKHSGKVSEVQLTY